MVAVVIGGVLVVSVGVVIALESVGLDELVAARLRAGLSAAADRPGPCHQVGVAGERHGPGSAGGPLTGQVQGQLAVAAPAAR